MESYYRRFEAAITTAGLENFTATTHAELNRTYAGDDNDDITRRFQAMCLLALVDPKTFSGVWNDLKKYPPGYRKLPK